jgi:hypothetical protein
MVLRLFTKPNHPLPSDNLPSKMPINLVDLEAAIRNAVPVAHLEVEDQSSGCGENYAIVLVSEVGSILSCLVISSDADKSLGIRGEEYIG